MLERINVILAHIHQGLLSWIPPHSGDLAEVVDDWFMQNRLPEIALVAGTCKAAGGKPEDPKLMRIMTALLAEIISMDILNDFSKKNNPQALWLKVGAERAMNYSHMLQVLFGQLCVQQEDDTLRPVLNKIRKSILVVVSAANRAGIKEIHDWESYWKYTEISSGHFTGALTEVGAELASGQQPIVIDACRNFGIHLGLGRHIINELINFSEPGLRYPGHHGISLGVLYGLHCEHPHQMELKQIVWQDHLEIQRKRVKEILDLINTCDYLIWAALKEKKQAIEMIRQCPDAAGKDFLEAFTIESFSRISALDRLENVEIAKERQVEIPQLNADLDSGFTGTLALDYQSIGLGIRKNIRSKPLQINY